jgi:hypothetical protein
MHSVAIKGTSVRSGRRGSLAVPDCQRSRTLPRVHRRRSFPRVGPSRRAPSSRKIRRPHISPADAAPSPPSTAGASRKWSPRRSKGSGQGNRTKRRQGNHEPVIVWQVEAIVRAELGSDVCWCANALTKSTRSAMTDQDTHPPRQPRESRVTQKRNAAAWGSMRARLVNPAILAAMPLPLATSGRRTSSFCGRAHPRDRAERRVR